jgi:hypothetical protein
MGRSRHGRLVALALVGVLTVAGCASVSPGVGYNSVLGYENLASRLRTFYRQRAWERNATCPLPRMDAILSATVIDETEDRIVARVRYSWRDDARLDDDGFGAGVRFGIGGSGSCRGIDERRFTLEKVNGGVRIVDMSGPQRPNPIGR